MSMPQAPIVYPKPGSDKKWELRAVSRYWSTFHNQLHTAASRNDFSYFDSSDEQVLYWALGYVTWVPLTTLSTHMDPDLFINKVSNQHVACCGPEEEFPQCESETSRNYLISSSSGNQKTSVTSIAERETDLGWRSDLPGPCRCSQFLEGSRANCHKSQCEHMYHEGKCTWPSKNQIPVPAALVNNKQQKCHVCSLLCNPANWRP